MDFFLRCSIAISFDLLEVETDEFGIPVLGKASTIAVSLFFLLGTTNSVLFSYVLIFFLQLN